MKYVLGNMLGGGFVGGLDPDAKGYIDTVVAAGGTVSGGQKSAINTFYKTGKSAGWYSLLKRLYLPIWGNHGPNAIDLIELGSGSFQGNVTPGAGFVQSDGTTGWMDTGVTAGALGLTTASAYSCFLAKTNMVAADNFAIGSRNFISQQFGMSRSSSNLRSQIMTNTSTGGGMCSATIGTNEFQGILSGSRANGTRFNARRATSGRTNLVSVIDGDFGTVPTPTIALMGLNVVTTGISLIAANEFGGFAIGMGMTDAQDEAFTLALKNLWETCTQLTLP